MRMCFFRFLFIWLACVCVCVCTFPYALHVSQAFLALLARLPARPPPLCAYTSVQQVLNKGKMFALLSTLTA